ncbi:MAG TPA: tetratricopeptide repeat protein [Blastocatellia bacterium]|nr:tetratricopeptide repeat protein [Blastocatellia bacterium]
MSLGLCLVLIALPGCRSSVSSKAAEITSLAPCALALAPQRTESRADLDRIDAEIANAQAAVRQAPDPMPYIERLGWKYIEKARLSYDPGYYKIAEQCAACLQAWHQPSVEALLLRGHVLHALHRFKEAEGVARELVSRRNLAVDHGLLGDVLMEQGRLPEAIVAYQKMMDLKPGPAAYSRAAHLRWLKGDLEGAHRLMSMAAQATGAGDAESAAWAYARLALYELQAGAEKRAAVACDAAISLQPDYAPALLACGRVMMAEGRTSAALTTLQRAANLNPLPEYQWLLADLLREAGRESEASGVEAQLLAHGGSDDPRTFALFLATRGEQLETALKLAGDEQQVRGDVFTLDALAWALTAVGRHHDAYRIMQRALAEGTRDARLFFHAAVIAAKSKHLGEARRHGRRARELENLLLPSEKEQLRQLKV